MTPDQVVASARLAVADRPFFADALANPCVRIEAGCLIWTVTSMTIDTSISVDVDDASGRVTAVREDRHLHARP